MELLLGTAQLLGNYGYFQNKEQPGGPCEILNTAASLGFSGLDTAPAYVGVEQAIGRCGWPNRIHTKIEPGLDPVVSLEGTLASLLSKSVDVLYFHDPEVVHREPSFFSTIRHDIPQDIATSIGVSIYSPAELEAALEIPEITAVQIPLNIADGRFSDDLLLRASERRVRVYARSIFLQGALLQPPEDLPAELAPLRKLNEALQQLALGAGLSRAELCIAWVKARPGMSGLVLGAETTQQVRELSRAFRSRYLTDHELEFVSSIQLKDPLVLDPRNWGVV